MSELLYSSRKELIRYSGALSGAHSLIVSEPRRPGGASNVTSVAGAETLLVFPAPNASTSASSTGSSTRSSSSSTRNAEILYVPGKSSSKLTVPTASVRAVSAPLDPSRAITTSAPGITPPPQPNASAIARSSWVTPTRTASVAFCRSPGGGVAPSPGSTGHPRSPPQAASTASSDRPEASRKDWKPRRGHSAEGGSTDIIIP